ncbi:MAG: TRAP transporter small permease subunit [OCS116 cluster bacterium]|nr:TRAP transporter small permease subunit [OCS116 cluster bacterium]
MLNIANAITTTNKHTYGLVKWIVFIIAGLMVVEVISRYSLTAPTSWAPELATLLFGPFFLLGGPYLLHMGGHVAVDLVSSRATGKLKMTLEIVAISLAMVFGGILLWFSVPLVMSSFNYAETSYSAWNPIIWPSKAALPFASLLLLLQGFAELVFIVEASNNSKTSNVNEVL